MIPWVELLSMAIPWLVWRLENFFPFLKSFLLINLSIYLFIYLFIFTVVQLQLSPFPPITVPCPTHPPPPTFSLCPPPPLTIVFVHGSFIHLPWLDPFPSFPCFPLPTPLSSNQSKTILLQVNNSRIHSTNIYFMTTCTRCCTRC